MWRRKHCKHCEKRATIYIYAEMSHSHVEVMEVEMEEGREGSTVVDASEGAEVGVRGGGLTRVGSRLCGADIAAAGVGSEEGGKRHWWGRGRGGSGGVI